MKKNTFVLFFLSSLIFAQNAWINEFHYDNAGSPDVGEFVEVAIVNAGTYDLNDFRISFYSSTSGTRYGVYHQLSTFDVGSTENNITLYSKLIESIQNGSNDGIALDYQNGVMQFISYEGTLSASEGVANGITSVDVGVVEDNSTAIGSSIGLIGNGSNFSSFTWAVLSDDSPGQPNSNQALPVELTTFSASIADQNIELNWETTTEVNNYGFNVERASILPNNNSSKDENWEWENIGFVEGHGNSNSPKYYSFIDNMVTSGKYLYRLIQVDIDGTYEYSDVVEIMISAPKEFNLSQNFPNPFNPTTVIRFNLPQDSEVRLNVFNVLGEEVAELVKSNFAAGYHSVIFDANHLNSGIYFYKLESNNFTQIRKMLLVK